MVMVFDIVRPKVVNGYGFWHPETKSSKGLRFRPVWPKVVNGCVFAILEIRTFFQKFQVQFLLSICVDFANDFIAEMST